MKVSLQKTFFKYISLAFCLKFHCNLFPRLPWLGAYYITFSYRFSYYLHQLWKNAPHHATSPHPNPLSPIASHTICCNFSPAYLHNQVANDSIPSSYLVAHCELIAADVRVRHRLGLDGHVVCTNLGGGDPELVGGRLPSAHTQLRHAWFCAKVKPLRLLQGHQHLQGTTTQEIIGGNS